jgi:hypothetical protein
LSQAHEWYRWKRRHSTELYLLWGIAALTYGGGDLLTTIILVYGVPGLGEANPFARWSLEAFGLPGLVALKLFVFAIALLVSRVGLRLLYNVPPVGDDRFGIGTTVVNLLLIF